jgi:hypothetical protein
VALFLEEAKIMKADMFWTRKTLPFGVKELQKRP